MRSIQITRDPESIKAGYYFRAISGARRVLNSQAQEVKSDELHHLKSVFYVAVERLGMRADRLFSLQRQLREVFAMINMRVAMNEFEKQAALQLIDELESRLRTEFPENVNSGGCS